VGDSQKLSVEKVLLGHSNRRVVDALPKKAGRIVAALEAQSVVDTAFRGDAGKRGQ
jgi:hypothetical protein